MCIRDRIRDVEGEPGIVSACDADHLWGEIHAVWCQSATGEERGQSSCAAADVTDRGADGALQEQVAKNAEHSTFDRHLVEDVREPVCIHLGQDIVRVAQLLGFPIHQVRLAIRPDGAPLSGMAAYRCTVMPRWVAFLSGDGSASETP